MFTWNKLGKCFLIMMFLLAGISPIFAATSEPVVADPVETPQAAIQPTAAESNPSGVTMQDLIGGDTTPPPAPEPATTKPSSTKNSGGKPDTTTDTKSLSMSAMAAGGASDGSLPQKLTNNFQVDTTSGSGIINLPLYTPPGRKGLQPSLNLSYSHHNPNGVLGYGWGVDFGFIERSTKKGVPKYDATDTFVANLGGQMDLVSIGNNDYRARVEGGFVNFKFVNPHWEAKDKQGNTYYFGLDTVLADNSRVMNGANVYRWYLSEVKDVFGNYYFIQNFADGSFKMYYTGEPGTDRDSLTGGTQKFSALVEGVVEDTTRQDPITSYKSRFLISQTKRLKEIRVSADGNLMRKYAFHYHYSARTNRSLLDSITEYGQDGTTAMPAVSLSYQETELPTYSVVTTNDTVAGNNLWNGRFSSDYERGHDNYGPVHYFDTVLGPTYTQAHGTWDKGYWNIEEDTGRLEFASQQDCANYFWTFAYIKSGNPTIQVPILGNGGPAIGVWINGEPAQNNYTTWNLRQGYNLIEVTGYHQHASFSFDLNKALKNSVDLLNSSQVLIPSLSADFNGDGLTDVATFYPSEGRVNVALSNGSTFREKEPWITGFATNINLVLGDFNGDGKTDLASYNTPTGEIKVALSDGTRFVDQGTWFLTSESWMPATGDVNGDGLTDMLMIYRNGPYYYAEVDLNTGNGSFAQWTKPDFTLNNGDGDQNYVSDFNADGLADFITYNNLTGNWTVRLNEGATCTLRTLQSVNNFGLGKNIAMFDINSDGLTDIGYYDSTNGKIYYKLLQGETFGPTQEFPVTFSLRDPSAQVQTSDFNGDGLTDFVLFNQAGQSETALSTGKVADLMSTVQNGLGGKTAITYGSSAYYANTYLPFTLPVVTAVTAENSLGDSYTTRYSYGKGKWDTVEREFFGFGEVKVIDADGNYSLSTLRQDDIYLRGRPVKSETFDKDGNLFGKSENTWSVADINTLTTPPIKFPYLSRTDNYVFDGNATGRRTAQTFYYDETPQQGNLTKSVQLGEVNLTTGADISGDSRTLETDYLNNTTGTNRLIGFPKETRIKDNAGTLVRRSRFYYDNSTDLNALPTLGSLTKKEDWAGTAVAADDPTTLYTYDTYGNLLTTTDPKGNASAITYDSKFHLFAVSAQNALAQAITTDYYGVNGVSLNDGTYRGLWGQVKSTTDPNNQKGTQIYDVFGRGVKSIGPLDTVALPTTIKEYLLGNPYTTITTRQRIQNGQSATLDTVEIVDGLGRLIQTKAQSATSGQNIVTGRTVYNARGLAVAQYLPRFVTTALDTVDPIDTNLPHSTVDYDSMGRVLKTTNPDGTFASVAYDDWMVSGIDENGHMQKSYSDAYGRLIKKEEYSGADGRSPNYPALGYALYATTNYTYDSEGNLVQVKDAKNNTTTITYDTLGRKKTMRDPDMGYWQYGYDKNGNLSWQIDAKNQRLDFQYDVLNRLLNKSDAALITVNYSYDEPTTLYAKGRLHKALYKTADQTRFFYDQLGRETQSRKKINGVEYAVARTYDGLSRLANVVYPQNEKATYTYNAAGQIKAVTLNMTGGVIPPVPQTPAAPTLSTAVAGNVQVALTWTAVEGATSYSVRYGTTSGNYTTTVNASIATALTITGLTNNTTYYFAVFAANQYGNSAVSNEKSAMPSLPQTDIAFDAASSTQADNVSTISWNHTVSALSNRALVVSVSLRNYGTAKPTPQVSSMNYGGQTMTLIARKSNTSSSYKITSEMWYVLAPASGTRAVSATFNGTIEGVTIGAVSLTGVKQAAPEASASGSGNTNKATASLTTLTNKAWVIDSMTEHLDTSTVTITSGQTAFYNQVNAGAQVGAGSYKMLATKGSTSMSWNFNASRYWAEVVASFAPVGQVALLPGTPAESQLALLEKEVRSKRQEVRKASSKVQVASSTTSSKWQVARDKGRVAFPLPLWEGVGGGDSVGNTESSLAFFVSRPGVNPLQGPEMLSPRGFGLRNTEVRSKKQEVREASGKVQGTSSKESVEIPSPLWGGLGRGSLVSSKLQVARSEGQVEIPLPLWEGVGGGEVRTDILAELSDLFLGIFHIDSAEAATMQAMDLKTFTEADSGSNITVTASAVAFTNIETRKSISYVYKPQTHPGDFAYEFDTIVTAADTSAGPFLIWGVTNSTAKTYDNWTDGFFLAFNKTSSGMTLRFLDCWLDYEEATGFALNTRYYFRVSRTGTAITAKVYTDAAKTVLKATLVRNAVDDNNTISYNNLYAFATDDNTLTTRKATGDVRNLAKEVAGQSGPSAPVLNSATAGNAKVTLAWGAVSGATGYKVKYGTASGSYSTIVDVGNVTTKDVTGLTNSQAYYFVVTAYNANGESGVSNEKTATPVGLSGPASPVLNSATAGDSKVTLVWGAVSGATGYKVKYGTASGSYSTIVDVGNVTTKDVTGLTNSQAYYFVVTAYNANGESGVSNEKSATPVGPSAPAAPVLNSATAGDGKVTLAWGSVSGATGYKVKYGTSSGSYPTTIDVGNVTTKDVTGLTNGQSYYFVVTAYNANGESGVSNEKNATPVVPPLPDQTAVITDVIYNASGQITKLTYGNGTVIDYTYNPLNLRLTNLKTTAPGGTVIQDLSYTYDSVGNILSINDAVNTADQTFEYDHLNRLTKATGQTYGAKTYIYDEIGNIVSKEGVSYVYGENAGPHAVTHLSDGTAFTYDANGNMATKVKAGVTTAYTYDAENRLINIKKNGALVSEYEYDGDGGRTRKKVYGATSTVTTEFIGSLFEKEDGHLSRHVFFGDKKVATVKDGTLVYTFDDHLGGANVITDASGAVKEIAEYTPFGTFARHDRQGSTDLTQNFFTGQRLDPEDGLYYYGARYYSPEIGRFITPDVTIQHTDDPQDLNRYAYCRNNPINNTDPTGLGFKSWFKKVFGDYGQIIGLVASAMFGPLGVAAFLAASGYTNNWKPAQNIAMNTLAGMPGGPMGMVSSVVTGAVLDTPQGRRTTGWVANEIYDDALGFSPEVAYMLAYVDLSMTGNFLCEQAIVNTSAEHGTVSKFDSRNARHQKGIHGEKSGYNSMSDATETINGVKVSITNPEPVAGWGANGDIWAIEGSKGRIAFLGEQPYGPGVHIGANSPNFPKALNMKYPNGLPLPKSLQLVTFGTCHQVSNATLLASGFSNVATQISGNYSTFVTTFVYGNYGGGLVQKANSVFQAQSH